MVWACYEDLPATIARVHADYAAWHARIFTDPGLADVLRTLRAENLAAVEQALAGLQPHLGHD